MSMCVVVAIYTHDEAAVHIHVLVAVPVDEGMKCTRQLTAYIPMVTTHLGLCIDKISSSLLFEFRLVLFISFILKYVGKVLSHF